MDRYETRKEEEGRADAIQLLKTDHQKVKDLYEEFQETDDQRARQQIVEASRSELRVHTAIEEAIFTRRFGARSTTTNSMKRSRNITRRNC